MGSTAADDLLASGQQAMGATRPHSMGGPSPTAALVAPSGRALRVVAGLPVIPAGPAPWSAADPAHSGPDINYL
jgi:hypothetical protein